jgi:hypothetical protein
MVKTVPLPVRPPRTVVPRKVPLKLCRMLKVCVYESIAVVAENRNPRPVIFDKLSFRIGLPALTSCHGCHPPLLAHR